MASIPGQKWQPHAVRFWLNLPIISISVVVALGYWWPASPAATALTAPERTVDQRESVTPMTNSISEPAMTISVALNNGKPTLILFYPVEFCQIRYCLNEAFLTETGIANDPDRLNVVTIPIYAVPSAENETPPPFPHLGWEVYPVPPFDSLLPEFSLTQFGWSIAAPTVVLVDEQGQVRYRGQEMPDATILGAVLRPTEARLSF